MADLFALLPEMGIGFALGFLVVQSASFSAATSLSTFAGEILLRSG